MLFHANAAARRGGIGKATARLFAARGVHLALHYFSQHDVAIALVEELRASGVRVAAFQTDLADFGAVRAMHAKIVEELGHPDILYSNAAMAGTTLGIKAKIEDASLDEFEKAWRVNAGGAFLVSCTVFHLSRGVNPGPQLTQLCVPHMEKQGYGRIVFCSSIAAGKLVCFLHLPVFEINGYGFSHWRGFGAPLFLLESRDTRNYALGCQAIQ